MATGFELAYDLVHLHREYRRDPVTGKVSPGVPAEIRCLVPGAFLAAFAHGEQHLRSASKERGLRAPSRTDPTAPGTPLGPSDAGLVEAYSDAGIALAARARVAPRGTTSIWRWKLLEGPDLDTYLRDAAKVRNRIAHTGSPDGAKVRSEWFTYEDGRQASVTLMAVEGLLQAAQDVCYMAANVVRQRTWEWYLPERTEAGTMSRTMYLDERFPLPL